MTLIEAVSSGRKFRRTSVGGSFMTYEDFQEDYGLERQDVLANDYEVEADTGITLTRASLAAAWNDARGGFTSVKSAETSPMFAAIVSRLFS